MEIGLNGKGLSKYIFRYLTAVQEWNSFKIQIFTESNNLVEIELGLIILMELNPSFCFWKSIFREIQSWSYRAHKC